MTTKGLIQIYTGDGKGKTTAAFGLAMRAVGRGMKVTIVQFLKSNATGEVITAQLLDGITVIRVNASNKFTWSMTPLELTELAVETKHGYDQICQLLTAQSCDVLILDEINHVINKNYLSQTDIIHLFKIKPENMEMVLTGRNAPQWLMEMADLVTEMKCIKHPFSKGIGARTGIEN